MEIQVPRLLRMPQVVDRVGLKRSRILELEKEGLFPVRRQISKRATGWMESDVSEWIENRPVAESRAVAGRGS